MLKWLLSTRYSFLRAAPCRMLNLISNLSRHFEHTVNRCSGNRLRKLERPIRSSTKRATWERWFRCIFSLLGVSFSHRPSRLFPFASDIPSLLPFFPSSFLPLRPSSPYPLPSLPSISSCFSHISFSSLKSPLSSFHLPFTFLHLPFFQPANQSVGG